MFEVEGWLRRTEVPEHLRHLLVDVSRGSLFQEGVTHRVPIRGSRLGKDFHVLLESREFLRTEFLK